MQAACRGRRRPRRRDARHMQPAYDRMQAACICSVNPALHVLSFYFSMFGAVIALCYCAVDKKQ